ncbi:hypothetical protein DYB32_006564 [Aphanomyces invadans]|uniref:Uncharacterized protein n=1 Tax=Aphanomyces invadans TaxID=157072 RepID=A0A3R6V8F8_9STRA|nr:hypothetical protein DYB32_006564 [Aphanomyces invadans]
MHEYLVKVLEVDNQEWILQQEVKLVVSIITNAIKPAPLQVAVTKQLQLQWNMVIKADVFRYVKWLRQFTVSYQLDGGIDEEKQQKSVVEVLPKDYMKPRSRRNQERGEKKPNGAQAAPSADRAEKVASQERTKVKCLKYQSNSHRVRNHLGLREAQIKQLMDEHHQARRRMIGVSRDTTTSSMECRESIEVVLQ